MTLKDQNTMEKEHRGPAGRKVGILGGTFDPIHTAHLIIAEAAYDAFDLDEVLLMPSGHSYFKDQRSQKVLPPEIRYQMVCEAAADNPHFTPSDFEIHREGNTYTCDTLRGLREQNPENHYYFIVGADSIRDILTWRAFRQRNSSRRSSTCGHSTEPISIHLRSLPSESPRQIYETA